MRCHTDLCDLGLGPCAMHATAIKLHARAFVLPSHSLTLPPALLLTLTLPIWLCSRHRDPPLFAGLRAIRLLPTLPTSDGCCQTIHKGVLTSMSLHASAGVPVACCVSDSNMAARIASGSSSRLFGAVIPVDPIIVLSERRTMSHLSVTCGRRCVCTSRSLVSAGHSNIAKTVMQQCKFAHRVARCHCWPGNLALLLQRNKSQAC